METGQKIPNILITGTPGVGKTSFSMLLVDKLNEIYPEKKYKNVNIGKLINEKHLYKKWNDKFDVPEFDDEMVINELEPIVKEGGIVLDFHSSAFLPEEWIDLVVLLRCNNTLLYDRLKARGYNENKIQENVECEIMEVTSEEVRDSYKEEIIIELKSEEVEDMQRNLKTVIDRIKSLN